MPQSLEDVSVQLIYSEGGQPAAIENFWEFYLIALVPFVLGVPRSQVELFLAAGFCGINASKIDAIVADIFMDPQGNVEYLPAGYKDYFYHIYSRASFNFEDIATLPSRSIRIISGHGFGNYSGGYLICGGKKVLFSKLGSNATVLTILDICNSPHAVASMNGSFPNRNPRKFNNKAKQNLFSKELSFPVACDRNEAVWSFRIGYRGQHRLLDQKNDFRGMSAPFRDSVAYCILAAIKSMLEDSLYHDSNLDDLFCAKYKTLQTPFIPIPSQNLHPFSALSGLHQLISNKILNVNLQAYECELFQNNKEWFLTTERALALAPDEGMLASRIIDFLADQIKCWHEKFPNSVEVLKESEDAWERLRTCLGPFFYQLKLVAFELDEETNKLYRSPDGVPLEEWAYSCGGLPKCVERVEETIETGKLDVVLEEPAF